MRSGGSAELRVTLPNATPAALAAAHDIPLWPPPQGLEKYVMSKVWRQTFAAWQEDQERDERYQRLMQVPCQ